MNQDSFASANIGIFAGQMADAWQKVMTTWWASLLQDPGKLSELRSRLSEGVRMAPSTTDISKVVEVLELMEGRLQAVEGRLNEVTHSLQEMVRFLEGSRAPGAPAGSRGGKK